MKKKSLLLTAVATLGLTAATMAQNVPNYVPTNGLVGWWPFTGNANDESGNGYNGTPNGVGLSSDRFGSTNNSFIFNNPQGNYISTNCPGPQADRSISLWFKQSVPNSGIDQWPLAVYGCCNQGNSFGIFIFPNNIPSQGYRIGIDIGASYIVFNPIPNISQWHHIVANYSLSFGNTVMSCQVYLDGVLLSGIAGQFNPNIILNTGSGGPLTIGGNPNFQPAQFQGNIDDIGIWNRALTQQEITDLYNAVNCANNTTITPSTNTLNTGSTAIFSASTSDSNPSHVWQSDFGQGYVTLNNFGNYSGTNTATLNLSNVQLSNHNLPIRVITTSGNCIDTSNVAVISIVDTCINTITDTTLITVTDTLLINTNLTGVNPPNNVNTIKIFPNPANDHITINYGNFSVMNGYQLKIENSIGQQVFQTNITQQSDYLNLTTWSGNGLYFVHIINPQGNTIDIRKIVLQ